MEMARKKPGKTMENRGKTPEDLGKYGEHTVKMRPPAKKKKHHIKSKQTACLMENMRK